MSKITTRFHLSRFTLLSLIYIMLIIIFFYTRTTAVYGAWYVDKYGYLVQDNAEVLGVVYAKEGGDDGGDDNNSGNNSNGGSGGNSGSSGSGSSDSGSSGSDGRSSGSGGSSGGSNVRGNSGSSGSGGRMGEDSVSGGSSSGPIKPTTRGDCIGPDGMHMQVSFQACLDFNSSWGNSNFSFTPSQTTKSQSSKSKSRPKPKKVFTPQTSFDQAAESLLPTDIIEPSISESPEQESEIDNNEIENENKKTLESSASPRIKIEENRTEIRLSEDEKIKTRTKNGETRTDVYSGGVKVRLEQKNGRLIIKAESETGEDVELGEQEIFKIDERVDKNSIKVATGSGNSFIISRGNVAATTQVPLLVDLATNTLTVQTPSGSKMIAVLPDAAVRNMLAANVIDKVGILDVSQQVATGSVTGVKDLVELGLRNNLPIYEIAGISNQKLLGFIPIEILKTVVVSAETGEIVTTEINPLMAVLDFISF